MVQLFFRDIIGRKFTLFFGSKNNFLGFSCKLRSIFKWSSMFNLSRSSINSIDYTYHGRHRISKHLANFFLFLGGRTPDGRRTSRQGTQWPLGGVGLLGGFGGPSLSTLLPISWPLLMVTWPLSRRRWVTLWAKETKRATPKTKQP